MPHLDEPVAPLKHPPAGRSRWQIDALLVAGACFAIELGVHYALIIGGLDVPDWVSAVIHGSVMVLLAGPLVAWILYHRRLEAAFPGSELSPVGSPHQRVRFAILGALAVLVVPVAIGAWSQNGIMRRSAASARLVILAGRQRMLTQTIARDVSATPPAAGTGTLGVAIAEMDSEYEELHRLLDSLVVAGTPHLQVAQYALRDAQPARLALVQAARHARSGNGGDTTGVRHVLQRADAFLALMTAPVDAVQQFNQQDRRHTRELSLLLAGVVLLGLLLVGMLVVEPVVRIVQRQHAATSVRNADLERLSMAAERTSNVVIFTDASRRITWVNEGFTRVTGYTAEEALGQSPGALLQCEKTDATIVEAMRAAFDAGHGFHGEIINRSKSGRDYWLDLDIQPLFDAVGVLTGFLAIETDITDKIVQQQRLTSIFETVTEGVVLVGQDGAFVEWNSAATRILGVTSGELAGRDVGDPRWANIHSDGTPMTAGELPSMITLRTGLPLQNVLHGIRQPDGARRWVSVSTAPLRNAKGEVASVVASFTDITERLDRDTRLELVVAGAGLGTWDWHLPTGRAAYNARFPEMLGYDPSEFEPHYSVLHRLLHPDDKSTLYTIASDHLTGRTSEYRCEHRLLRKDGSWAWVLGVGKVTERGVDGEPLRAAGMIVDISASREAEAKLQRVTRSLEEAQAVAFMGSWTFDLATGAIEWSKQTYALFGRNESDGPPAYEELLRHHSEADAERLRIAVKATIETGTPYSLVMRTRAGNRGAQVVRAEGRARFGSTGEIVGMFGAVTDVTAEVEREEALIQARSGAELASRAKSEFLANMSHEIRTPLTAILGYTDLLRDEGEGEGAAARRLGVIDTIHRAGEHLLTVINDVLDLSKIEAGKLVVEQMETDLPRLLLDVDSLMRRRAIDKGIVLETTLSTPVPDRILTDPTRLRQVLLNLVGNATKFTERGRVDVRARVMERAGAQLLRIEIQDTGPGLTPRQAGTLFETFTQADASVTRKHGGSGLGLSICRRLATLMGGEVRLDFTAPGTGSLFVLELPLVGVTGSVLVQSLSAANTQASVSDVSRQDALLPTLHGRILLAEDGEDNERLIVFHLTRAGASVTVAANGMIALELLQAAAQGGRPFDLLVTDMQMPEMDGYTLARTLREQGSTIPIVALTAHALADDRLKCLEAGCDDYASKPIDKLHLLQTCARWLEHDESSDAIFASLASDLAGDPEMGELVELFLAHLADRVPLVERAYAARDFEALAAAAHQLKGAAGGYGYSSISDAASRVEQEAAHGHATQACTAAVALLVSRCRAALRGSLVPTTRVLAGIGNSVIGGMES